MKPANGSLSVTTLLLLTITALGVSASSQAPGMTTAASRVTVEPAVPAGDSIFHKENRKDKHDQWFPRSRLA